MSKKKIQIVDRDRFMPKLYADLYIPSYVNGYSIAMEYMRNWFISKFPKDFFRTIHIVGKHVFDDFRRFEKGDYIKREKPALSIGSSIQYDTEFENIDIHLLGIDRYMMKTRYQRSFFKDPINKRYLGMQQEVMQVNFNLRCRLNTRAEQMDIYKRMQLAFRIGCTETVDTDMDFHVPYELMKDMAKDSGFCVIDEAIKEPYEFLKYLNTHSQIPFLYKIRYINGKYEYFIRMNDIPLYLDMRNKPDPDDGEQEGQTSTNFSIDWQVSMKLLVPKFYAYYAEAKCTNTIHVNDTGINIYSMRIFDIPEVNNRGWIQYGTSNYIKDEGEEYVKEMDIDALFKAPIDHKVGISLDDLIEDSLQNGVSPSSFIDIGVYTNDMMANNGKIPVRIDWKNRKIILPDKVSDNYFYLAIYTDRLYVNEKIIDINSVYKNRVQNAKRMTVDRSQDQFTTDVYIEPDNNKLV